MNAILKFFQPAPHRERLPEAEVKRRYPRFRWAILESTFIGYATFYFVRNNLSVVSKEMGEALQYSKSDIGDILAITAISYGLGKFLMGSLSDRSNPRKFMPFGLLLTACANFAFGFLGSFGNFELHWQLGGWNFGKYINIYNIHLLLWSMNGLFQGMGWPPCGRSIGHWFSLRERGLIFSIWNTAHNVGGGLIGILAAWAAGLWGWQGAFYVPGVLALLTAVYLFLRLKDTPQSEGLPSIEEYNDDYPDVSEEEIARHEEEISTKELFIEHIFKNRLLWLIAIANFFVYIVRYSMLDWGPTYLKEAKGGDLGDGGWAVFVIEFGGIGSTVLMGWLSDRFGGRRGMVSLLCMFPILAAFTVIILNPPGHLWIDFAMLSIVGFFIYPPVMLLGVSALDLTSKKAVGTAAGFVGLFGYIGRTVQAKGLGWLADQPQYGWDYVLYAILVANLLAILLLALTWNIRPKS